MAPGARSQRNRPKGLVETTLLELVQAVSEVSESDREVVATVRSLLRSGRVRLTGTFRDDPPVH